MSSKTYIIDILRGKCEREMSSEEVGFLKMALVKRKTEKIPEIGVGVLGYAFMGKAHSHAYIDLPIFFYPPPAKPRLVAICGRNEELVREAAARYGYTRYYTDWRQLIKDNEVEVFDNCGPNNMHCEPCIEAAEAGKHILCEKPLATNKKEAKTMLEAVKRAGVKHMVGFNYRFVPAIILAKKIIEEKRLGRIYHFRARYLQEWGIDPNLPLIWKFKKEESGSGPIGDLGSHIIDLARYLVGEIKSVGGVAKRFIEERPLPNDQSRKGKVTVEDAFVATVEFENGAIGTFEATRFALGRKNFNNIEINCEKGSIEFNLERLNELRVYGINEAHYEVVGWREVLVTETFHPFIENYWPHGHIIGWEHTFLNEIYHFIDAIVNDKKIEPYAATFEDGYRCNVIMDAIIESAEKERKIIIEY